MINKDYLIRSHYFDSLYPKGLDLNDSIISKLNFSYDGPSLFVTFHTKKIPHKRPEKWANEINTVCIVFEFIDIELISFNKWGRENNIKFDMVRMENKYEITITGIDLNIKFKAQFMDMKSISAYIDEVN